MTGNCKHTTSKNDDDLGMVQMALGITHMTRPGKRLQFAIENCPVIVDLPIKNGDFP